MPPEVIIGLALFSIYSMVVWGIGWWGGAKTLRDRNHKFIELIKEDNKKRNPRSEWYRGYTEGIAVTLETLDRFLDGFREETDESA
jgi:hypothetical protein